MGNSIRWVGTGLTDFGGGKSRSQSGCKISSVLYTWIERLTVRGPWCVALSFLFSMVLLGRPNVFLFWDNFYIDGGKMGIYLCLYYIPQVYEIDTIHV